MLVPFFVQQHSAPPSGQTASVAETDGSKSPSGAKKSLLSVKRPTTKISGAGDGSLTPVADVRAKWNGQTKTAPPPPTDIRDIFQTSSKQPNSGSRIDALVFAKLRENNILPANLCSDGVFVRRVYLDVIGTLPTAEEAKAFLKDPDPKRREALIDRLLERPEFADYWAMRWSDILRVKSEFPINLWPNAARAYHHWIKTALAENMPYDRFARTLLTSSGSNFRHPPVNFYRAMQKKDPPTTARTVALTFMGVRPEELPAERWAEMEVFFSQLGYKATREWKEEIVYFDERKTLRSSDAVFPDGTPAKIPPGQDPRIAFADWLVSPKNPWFAQNIANRAWAWLLGRGIIHEADDARTDNPPSNPELLAYLQDELRAAKYDLKSLYRLILNSKTYQFSCIPASDHPDAAKLFAYYPVRRLDAEVLIDAICQISGTTEQYSSPIPEPFTYLPNGYRAISLPDASISSPFLEMFGRPSRDTGLESERSNVFTAGQRLHLLNSAHIEKKIQKGPVLAAILKSSKRPREIVEDLYLAILSRYPTTDELAESEIPSLSDIAWALINSEEFLCRH